MTNDSNDSGMELGLEDDYAGFFSPLENTKPYLKVAFEGFAGTGKTYTMARLAIRLHKRIGSNKPIVYVDSEKAGKFLLPLFRDAGIKVLHRETKSFADLMMAMKLMREQGAGDILLVDTITHYYENYIASYLQRVKRTKLQFEDWGIIKPTWKREFSEPLVDDPYHFFFTGRAGYEYDNEKNPETGKREIFKSGIKMKVEGETAFEPDMLILMERYEKVLGEDKQVWREATVIKDRSALLDGKTFKNPTGDEFMPAIEACLTSPVKRAQVQEADTGMIFATEEDKREWLKKRDVLVEEIEGLLVETWPGQSAEEKRAKILALKAGFQTASWTWIKGQRPEALADGKVRIEEHIAACAQQRRDAIAAEGPKPAAVAKVEPPPAPPAAAQPPAEKPAAEATAGQQGLALAPAATSKRKKERTVEVVGEDGSTTVVKVGETPAEAPKSLEHIQAG